MKTFLACILIASSAVGQEFSLSSGYHLYSTGSSLGVAASTNLMTWNNRKVIFRAGGAYYSGSTLSSNSVLGTRDRLEFSLESKNTMVTGAPYFNILQLGYHNTFSRMQATTSIERRTNRGFYFSAGFGTRISPPVSVMIRYLTGFDSGFRVGLEVDF